MTTLEAAYELIERHFFILPVPYREKNPALDGWNTLRIDKTTVRRYFSGQEQNMGIILGDDNGTADVDCDCTEAVTAARQLAPETKMIFGRQSKPWSHFFYRSDPPVLSKRYADPTDRKTLVELRCRTRTGMGHQTIVPPSVHKDTGENIRYEPGFDGMPANIDGDILQRAVARIAAAALLARHWPAAGHGRHDCELALAGCLSRAGWNLEDAQRFVLATYTAVPDHDRTKLDRVREAVRSTWARRAGDHPMYAFTTLAKAVSEIVAKCACGWLDLKPEQSSDAPQPAPQGTVTMAAGAFPASIENLNAMFVFYGWIQWVSFSQRGPMTLGTTTTGHQVIWPTIADLTSFAKARTMIAEGADILLPHPDKHRVNAIWEPAVRMILQLRARDARKVTHVLNQEVGDLLRQMYRHANTPVAKDSKMFMQYMAALKRYVRDREQPPPPCIFVAEEFCWVHVPTLRNCLSLPTLTNRLYPLADIRNGLLLLNFEYVEDITRGHDGDSESLCLWRGPLDVLLE